MRPKLITPQYYIDHIKRTTEKQHSERSLAEKAADGPPPYPADKLFGELDKMIKYPQYLALQSLAEVARCEWAAIEQAIRRGLLPAIEN